MYYRQNLNEVDERAKKFFVRGYVGPTSAKNDSGYIYSFDNDNQDARATKTFKMGAVFCSYCGKGAHSIQADIPKSYDVTGYMCTCEKAMDEIENQLAVEQLINKHREELKALKSSAPNVSDEAKHQQALKLMEVAQEYAAKGEWWRHERVIKDIAEGYKSK